MSRCWVFLILLAAAWSAQKVQAANPSGNLRIELIAGNNLVVDPNVGTPNSMAPSSAFLGAKFYNDGTNAMTNVIACIGNYSAQTPGIYPSRAHPPLVGPLPGSQFALTHQGGSMGLNDATRRIPAISPGGYVAVYWLVSYPSLDVNGTPVTQGSKPDDDLWLEYDIWSTVQAGGSVVTASVGRTVTMRSMISAMANKIHPNSANKVPIEYQELMDRYAPAWTNIAADGSPGTTILNEGVWYDLGNVTGGYDSDGDLVPDQNVWLQPVGDPGAFDPSCFRLERTYVLIVVKTKTGGDYVVIEEDQLYHKDLPDNNGAVGWVGYEFRALQAGCSGSLTPYQSAASGRLTEKFNGDYGASVGAPLTTKESEVLLAKTVDLDLASPGNTLTYTLAVTNSGEMVVGNPDLGMPLSVQEQVPTGTVYIANSATNVTIPAGISSYSLLFSTNGSNWQTAEPPAAQVKYIQWWFSEPLGTGTAGRVSFKVSIANPYTNNSASVINTGGLGFGDSTPFVSESAATRLLGSNSVSGVVFKDDGEGGGILGNQIQEGGEAGIHNISISLYLDGALVAVTNSLASGGFSFSNLFDGAYTLVVDSTDPDLPAGYVLTTPDSCPASLDPARTNANPVHLSGKLFGFAPPLTMTKSVAGGYSNFREGSNLAYNIVISNSLPGNPSTPVVTEYTIWATNGAVVSGAWTAPSNAYMPPYPDTNLAVSLMSGGDDIVTLNGYQKLSLAAAITNVQLRYIVTISNSFANDTLSLLVTKNGTSIYSVTNNLSSYNGATNQAFTVNLTSLSSWNLTDFGSGTSMVLTLNSHKVGGPDGGRFCLDQVGFRIQTESGGGGGGGPATNALVTLPLADRFDADELTYVSASPPPDRIETNGSSPSTTGILTWENLGPLYGGSSRVVTVNYTVNTPQNNALTSFTNLAVVSNAVFDSGLPANTLSAQVVTTNLPAGKIGYLIWGDLNSNGVMDGVERGISEVSMRLTPPGGVDLGNGAGNPITNRTDVNGEYFFKGLPASGTYTVTVLTNTLPGGGGKCVYDPDGTTNASTAAAITYDAADGSNRSLTNNFGFVPVNSLIEGSIWHDLDRDGSGVRAAGEDWLSGVVVYLCSGTSPCGAGGAVATNTTDSLGAFRFTGNYSGDYTVSVRTNYGTLTGSVWVASWDTDWPDSTNYVSLNVSAGGSERADFSYYKTGTNRIGDQLFFDLNSNGVREAATEEGMADMTVRLYEDANGNGNVDAADDGLMGVFTTGTDGVYLFTNLPATNFIILVDAASAGIPPQYLITADPWQFMDGKATLTITTTNRLDQDFGYYPYGSGSIASYVWHDVSADGIRSGLSETGLVGVAVRLEADYNGDGTYVTLSTNFSAASGAYAFTNLPDGDYRISVSANDPAIPTNVLSGRFVATTPTQYVVEVSNGQAVTSAKFGFATLGAVGDQLFWDANKNGTFDLNEPGVTGAVVKLYRSSIAPANLVASMTTDSNGTFLFKGLTSGYYVVDVPLEGVLLGAILSADPIADGIPCQQTNICNGYYGFSLSAGQVFMGADFGYEPTAGTLGETLWLDSNGNGVRDTNEYGIAYIPIHLLTGAVTIATSETDGDGYYVFANVPDGTYSIVVETTNANFPSGMAQVYGPDNTLNGQATNIIVSGGVVTNIGGSGCSGCDMSVNFGYRYLGTNSLAGTVQLEGGSGHGPATAPIPNAVIYLYLWNDDNGDHKPGSSEITLLVNTSTDANGAYAFTDLPTGNGSNFYLVSMSAPLPSLLLTTTTSDTPATVISNTVNAQGYTDSAWQGVPIAAGPTITGVDFSYVPAVKYDFGDAPGTYGTVLADIPSGARHVVKTSTNLYLGGWVRTELDGIPSADALGDGDEEDGVAPVPGWINGTNGGTVVYTVSGATSGWLTAYLDFNRNGAFSDSGELIISKSVALGTHTTKFTVADNTFNATNAVELLTRFRLHPSVPPFPALAYSGSSENGEVEDYLWDFAADIRGIIWNDRNANSIVDPYEPFMESIRVYLDLNSNGVWEAIEPYSMSGTNGAYSLSGINMGAYWMAVDAPAGVTHVSGPDGTNNPNHAVLSVTNSALLDDVNFGYIGSAAVGDFTWDDLNANGIQDPGEPGLAGVAVGLYDAGTNLLYGTVSGMNGTYSMSEIIPGDYLLGILTPAGYSNTLYDQGGDDSQFHTETGLTDPFTLAAAQTRDNLDAGFVRMATNPADIAIVKTVDDDEPIVGQEIEYTISVTNFGPGIATSVTVTDAVPAGLTFTYVSDSDRYTTNNNLWLIGSLSNSAVTSLVIRATVNGGTAGWTITNTAVGWATQSDTNGSGNTGTVTLVVQASGAPNMVILGTNGSVIESGSGISSANGTDFGSISTNDFTCHTFGITNSGTLSLAISSISTNGDGAEHFIVAGMPSTVDPATVSNFTVCFSPSAVGAQTATIAVVNNSTNTPYLVNLAGTGIEPAILGASPLTLTYNAVYGGTNPASQTLAVTNLGDVALTYTNTFPASWFGLSSLTGTLAGGSADALSATATSTNLNAGTYLLTNIISSPEAINGSVTVLVELVVAQAPQTITFDNPGPQNATNVIPLTGSSSSGLPVVFTNITGPATWDGTNLTFSGAGTVCVEAQQSGNSNYLAAATVTNCFEVFTISMEVLGTNGAVIGSGSPYQTTNGTDFGSVPTNTTLTHTFTITNSGTAELVLTGWTTNGAGASSFIVSSMPANIPAGTSVTFQVTFDPSTPGLATGTLVIANNSTTTPYLVNLAGTGIEPPILGASPLTLTYNAVYGGTNPASQTLAVTNLGDAALTYTNTFPASWFGLSSLTGGLAGGTADALSATATSTNLNAGTYLLTNIISSPEAVNGPVTVIVELVVARAPQTITFDNPGAQNATSVTPLTGSSSSGLPVVFTNITGPATWDGTNLTFSGAGTVCVEALQPGNSNFLAAATVTNCFEVFTINMAVLGTNGALIASGSPYQTTNGTDFGWIPFHTSITNTFTITNSGTHELTIASWTTNGTGADSFIILDMPVTIPAGGTATFQVVYNPQVLGVSTATIAIVNDSPTTPYLVNVAGQSGSPDMLVQTQDGTNVPSGSASSGAFGTDFGTVPTGTTVSVTLVITNNGSATLDLTGWGMEGDASHFAVSNMPASLLPGQTGEFTVYYTPGDLGAHEMWLSITNNTGTNPYTVGFGGAGIRPGEISIKPVVLTYVGYYGGPNPADQTFAMSNAGHVAFGYGFSITYGETSGWFSAHSMTGYAIPGAMLVHTGGVEIAGIAVGSYWATNTITSQQATNSPVDMLIHLIILPATQTITFAQIPDQPVTNEITLTATSSSGLPIVYTNITGPVLWDGSNLAFTCTGEVTVVATQPGDANHEPAIPVTNTFMVLALEQEALVLSATSPQMYATTNGLSLTGGSGSGATELTLVSGPATLNGTNLVMNSGTGVVTLTAYKPGDCQYLPQTVTALVVAAKAPQTITFDNPGPQNATNVIPLTGSSSSGLPVSFTNITGPATWDGTNLTFSGAGTVCVEALQPGNSNFLAAATVTNCFEVFTINMTVLGTNGAVIGSGSPYQTTNGTDFGWIPFLTSITNTFTITNSGTHELTIASWTTNGTGADSFIILDMPTTIPAGGTATFQVVYNPQMLGVSTATIAIVNDSPTTPYLVNVAGQSGSPDMLVQTQDGTNVPSGSASSGAFGTDFGTVPTGTTVSVTLVITNNGSATLDLTGWGMEGDASHFAVSNMPASLLPGQTGEFTVYYTPGDLGVHEMWLSITNNTGTTPYTIGFGGAGIRPGEISIKPVVLTYVGYYGGPNPADQTFAMSNAGHVAFGYGFSITYGETSGWFSAHSMTGYAIPGAMLVHTGGVEIAGIAVGSYWATNTITSQQATNSPVDMLIHLIILPATQTITFAQIPDQPVTNEITLTATSSSGLPIVYTNITGPVLWDGSNLAFTCTGEVTVVATQPGDANHEPAIPVTNTFMVLALEQEALVLSATSPQMYATTNGLSLTGGSGSGATELTLVSGPATLNGTNLVMNSGTGVVMLTAYKPGDCQYLPQTVTALVVAAKAPQTITFDNPGPQNATNVIPLTGSSSSGLPVSFTNITGPATWDGTNLTFSGAGTVCVEALQPGNSNFLAAATVTNCFEVFTINMTVLGTNGAVIGSGSPYQTTNGTDFGWIPFLTSITNTFTITNSGTHELTIASWTTNGTGADSFIILDMPTTIPAGGTATFQVVYNPQMLGVSTATIAIVNDSPTTPYLVNVAGQSGSPDMLVQTQDGTNVPSGSASSGAFGTDFGTVPTGTTVSVTLVITNNGSATLDLTGWGMEGDASHFAVSNMPASLLPGQTGEFTVYYTPGDLGVHEMWLSITNNTGTTPYTIGFGGAGIRPGEISIKPVVLTYVGYYGGPNPADQTFAMSNAGHVAFGYGFSITYGETSGWFSAHSMTGYAIPGAMLVHTGGVEIAGIAVGSYWATNTITSQQATNSPVDMLIHLIILPATQTITFAQIPDQPVTNEITLTATSSSGLPIVYTNITGPVLWDGSNLAFTCTGEVTVVATQPGDANHEPAIPVTNTFMVLALEQEALVLSATSPQMYATTNGLSLTGGSGSGATELTLVSGPATLNGTNLVMNSGTGVVMLTAYKPGDCQYLPQTVTALVVAAKAPQSIVFDPIADQWVTNAVVPDAIADSGQMVIFTNIVGPAVWDGTNLTFTGTGMVTIVAIQPGDDNWSAAPPVTNTFQVLPTPPIVVNPWYENVTATSAWLGAVVSSTGSAPVTIQGIVWSTNEAPDYASDPVIFQTGIFGTNAYSPSETGLPVASNLPPGTWIYFVGFATNAAGMAVSETNRFLTLPMVDVLPPTEVATNQFTAHWSPSPSATNYFITVSNQFGIIPGCDLLPVGDVQSVVVTGLVPGTVYYYSVIAENEAGTGPVSGVEQASTQGPELMITPAYLYYYAVVDGPAPNAQSFAVSNAGPVAGTYTNQVTYGAGAAGWLTAPATGTLASGASQAYPANVNHAGLSTGVYYATNTIYPVNAGGLPRQLIVQLTVAPRLSNTTASLQFRIIQWKFDSSLGLFQAQMEICNRDVSPIDIKPPYWYAMREQPGKKLWYGIGLDADGRDYVDVTDQVVRQVPDRVMYPGDCIIVSNLWYYSQNLRIPEPRDEVLWAIGETNYYKPPTNINPVITAPTAYNTTLMVPRNGARIGWALASNENFLVKYELAIAPTNGEVVVSNNGWYKYTPRRNYAGADAFFFRAWTVPDLVATGRVDITVTGPLNPAAMEPWLMLLLLDPEETP